MTTQNVLTASLFKGVIIDKPVSNSSRTLEMISTGLKNGVFLTIEVASQLSDKDFKEIIKLYGVDILNANSTFYKTFEEMVSKSDFELSLDQFLHYASTYGEVVFLQNHGEIYEPRALRVKEILESQEIKKALTTIQAFTDKDVESKIQTLLYSGIALKSQDVVAIRDLVEKLSDRISIDIDKVKNKEFQVLMMTDLGFVSKDVDTLMRSINYLITNRTQLVKSNRDYKLIDYNLNSFTQSRKDSTEYQNLKKIENLIKQFVSKNGYRLIAENSNRYRKLLLLIRKHVSSDVKSIINTITRKAKTQAIPADKPDMMKITEAKFTVDRLVKVLSTMNPFQLVRAYNSVNDKIAMMKADEQVRIFRIRNGRSFVKVSQKDTDDLKLSVLESYLEIILNTLVSKIDLDSKFVIVDDVINYAAPTSAKAFVGHIPENSIINMGKIGQVGVYWDKQMDLDFHVIDIKGHHVGWNSNFRDSQRKRVHSGDMVRLNEQGFAAEHIRFEGSQSHVKLSLNLFNQLSTKNEDVNYKLLVCRGRELDEDFYQSYERQSIIDLNDVIASFKLNYYQDGSAVGCVRYNEDDNTFDYVFGAGAFESSYIPDIDIQRKSAVASSRKLDAMLRMKDILSKSSAKVVTAEEFNQLDIESIDEDNVIDLRVDVVTIDKFVELFETND